MFFNQYHSETRKKDWFQFVLVSQANLAWNLCHLFQIKGEMTLLPHDRARILPRAALAVGIIAIVTVALAPPLAESVPQYPGTFVKTNHSRHVTHSAGDNQHRNGGHRERHSATQVQTTTGMLHGIRRNVLGKEVHVYLGVPFGKPPLGPLRFKKPIPLDPWNGTYYALNQPNTCYQEHFESFPGFKGEMIWNPNTNISEDCLYLNMWVPKTRKPKMPIMIWIYGGGYMAGTATLDIYNGDILAAENSVIVVGIQYRVGSFGFLYYGNEDAPGKSLLQTVLFTLLSLYFILQDSKHNVYFRTNIFFS